MSETNAYLVRPADWVVDRAMLSSVRREVFIVEQAVPEPLEWDEFDPVSRHALAVSAAGAAIGTARLLPDGHIGRMAVLAPWRSRGVGSALLRHMIATATQAGLAAAVVNAQVQALAFYRRFGFVAEGEPFDDASIEHMAMRLALE